MENRLAAILHGDVVGFSRVMGRDEAGTARRMKEMRSSVWDVQLAKHGGRLVNTAGDALLAIFPTVRGAVDCALEMQSCLTVFNEGVAPDARMMMRFGVNLGDVILDGPEIYGEGVNVAARLQALAEPGGICISRQVREAIACRIAARFIDDGRHELKNIAKPVEVFRWRPSSSSVDTSAPTVDSARLEMMLEATDAQGQVHRLRLEMAAIRDASGGLIVGRQAGCDILVLHPSVSRRHARLTAQGSVVMIEDLKSTNGTIVAGVRLQPETPVPIMLGRSLKLGDLDFSVRAMIA